jgi:hypothetical protein
MEAAPGSADLWALRAGPAFSYARGRLELELEAAYVGGPMKTTAFSGWESSLTGGPALSVRFLLGRLSLATTFGVELRYSWANLVRVDATRAQAAGLQAADSRTFPSLGPRAGLRVSLPLGHNLNVAAIVNFLALFRDEVSSAGGQGIVFHPTITAALGIGYAF